MFYLSNPFPHLPGAISFILTNSFHYLGSTSTIKLDNIERPFAFPLNFVIALLGPAFKIKHPFGVI